MARVVGPLLSLSASGQIAKVLQYQSYPGGYRVGKIIKQKEPSGAYQLTKQSWFADAVEHWHMLTDGEMDQWDMYVDSRGNDGYQAFISQYIRHRISDTPPWKLPDGTLWTLPGEKAIFGQAVFGQMVFGKTS